MKAGQIPAGALVAALPIATVVTAVVVGVALGVELALLVIAGGALAGVIALLWASVQSLTGEAPITLEEAMTLGAPSAEEEQKRSVLRALKDLEFERGVGKISEEDYAELSARYRAEAKRLIQLLDEGALPDRERAEKALRERLEKTAKMAANKPAAADAASDDAPSDAAPASAGSEPVNPAPDADAASPPSASSAREGEKAS